MTVRFPGFVALAIATSFAAAPSAFAVNISVTDECGKSLAGGSSATVNVASSGDLTMTAFSGSYTAGVGHCEANTGLPKCTLSASSTTAEPNGTVTLYAKCSRTNAEPLTQYTWTGPATGPTLPTNPASVNVVTLTFPAAGAYTYTVSAKGAGAFGQPSTPLTILVGDSLSATQTPTCVVTMSPVSILTTETSHANVVCHPAASTYQWDAAESGAPASPTGTGGVLTFPSAGSFTYKVAGKNAAGTAGPKASATVTVAANSGGGQSCTPAGVAQETAPLAASASTGDLIVTPGYTIAIPFTSPAQSGYVRIYQSNHASYTSYPYPEGTRWSVSTCKGDFTSPTGVCNQVSSGGGDFIFHTAEHPAYCHLVPNTQYYLNLKIETCSTGACGFRMNRSN